MSNDIPTLEGQPREKLGTRYTARLRKDGHTPAVIYGHGEDPIHVSFNSKAFNEMLHTGAHLFDLTISGKTEHCLLKALQWDYLGRDILHADFTRVNLNENVEVELEIELVGECKALQAAGAVLEHPVTSVIIACRANAIPENLQVDISELTDDAAIHVSDIQLPGDAEMVSDGEGVVAQIGAAKQIVEDEAAEGDEDAQPEVITEKKDEEAAE